jgi:hypothetical protein
MTLTRKQISQRYREKRRKDGICVQCTLPAAEGSERCDKHWLKHKEVANKFYRNRVDNGLCARCGNNARVNKTNCQKCLELERSEYTALRISVVDGYGGKCYCCGETEPCFLTVDHVNNDGAEHRRTGKAIGAKLYRFIIKHKFPPEFQLLCFNCNCGRQINNGVCSHKGKA